MSGNPQCTWGTGSPATLCYIFGTQWGTWGHARAYWADKPSSIETHQYLRNHTSSLYYTSAEEMSANISTWRCILWRFPGRPAGIDYEDCFHEHLMHFLYWIRDYLMFCALFCNEIILELVSYIGIICDVNCWYWYWSLFNLVIGDGNFKNDMLCHYSLA